MHTRLWRAGALATAAPTTLCATAPPDARRRCGDDILPPGVAAEATLTEIFVTEIRREDFARWRELWRGYLDFYEASLSPAVYEHTFARILAPDSPIRGLGARSGGASAALIGIAHYLFHAHAWTPREVCYLQDLFVEAESRGRGAGRELIEGVARIARERDCHRLYWTTQAGNTAARGLYDRIARWNGFIRYDYALD
jgi:ribosomal protein S18 acetylase RimI-like enzyme